MLAIFLKPLILRARRARKIKGFRKMAGSPQRVMILGVWAAPTHPKSLPFEDYQMAKVLLRFQVKE